MDRQSISLITFGFFRKDLSEEITKAVSKEFHLSVTAREGHLDLSEYYDPARRQYNANKILASVDAAYSSDDHKTLGLFDVDLFIPILTYVFGQAMLGGRTGIASMYRFSNERYGMEKNDKLALERFRKEVIHELGHTFGLVHCHHPDCVMQSSTYVEEIDQKDAWLCPGCRSRVDSHL